MNIPQSTLSKSPPAPMREPIDSKIVGVAKVLLNAGIINEKKALEILSRAEAEKISFVEALGRDNKITSRRAALELARFYDHPYFDLDSIEPEAMPSEKTFERKKIEELRVVPIFARGQKLFLATSDPSNQAGLEYFSHRSSGKRNELIVVDDAQISAYLNGSDKSASLEQADMDLTIYDDPEAETVQESTDDEREDSPVVKLVQGILLTAIKQGASDIHFEPYENVLRVRFRIDGVLREVIKPPKTMAKKIASRVKVMADLDITERRVPQDGKLRQKLATGRTIDFRVSTLPVIGDNEKIVMRILDPSQSQLGIDVLGYEPEQKAALLEAIHRPEGMVLVTGPTGSGKTVSLYTCLNILNTLERNISTAEDPAEIQLMGINQVNVNPAQGLTFPLVLKALLRQDPDIIMIGEIRDEETATIGVKAATTGHMVLATLHTNSAPKTVSRLVEIGVKPYEIAASVNLITAQRLLRRLCPHCRKKENVDADTLRSAGMDQSDIDTINKEWVPYCASKEGCDQCNGMGYKRRVGVYEVMPISEEMRKLISRNADSMAIAEQAKKEGIKNLRESGLLKYKQGLTSLEEVLGST